MGRYGGPSKVARHFSQLLDGNLPCCFYALSVYFLQGTSNICLSAGPLLVVKDPQQGLLRGTMHRHWFMLNETTPT